MDSSSVVTPSSGIQTAISAPQYRVTSGLRRRAATLVTTETTTMDTIPSRAQARAQASFLGSMIVMS